MTKKSSSSRELSFEEYVAVVVGLTFIGVAFFIGDSAPDTTLTANSVIEQTAQAVESVPQIFDNVDEPALIIQDIVEGEGLTAREGDKVYVHYVAVLENGDEFENTTDVVEPHAFTLGASEVIPGLEMGIVGMTEDAVRRIVVPAELAYGENGLVDPETGESIIPGKETLTYDVTLLAIE